MSKYQKSIIYKIYDNTNGNVYYGSTYNLLRVRMHCHRKEAKYDTKKCVSKQIILNGNYSYSMVEPYPCNSKQELYTRERYWIENFDCVNKIVPGRTSTEYYQENKEKIKEYGAEYRIKNKEELSKKRVKYWAKNKEKISNKRAEFYTKNKEEISNKRAEFYTKNKEKLCNKSIEDYTKNKDKILQKYATKIVCECGSEITQGSITRHRKSAKHAKLMTLICPPCPP